jgi:hypothetical protein
MYPEYKVKDEIKNLFSKKKNLLFKRVVKRDENDFNSGIKISN